MDGTRIIQGNRRDSGVGGGRVKIKGEDTEAGEEKERLRMS